MWADLPKYKSKFEAIGYICETGLREDLEFTKLDWYINHIIKIKNLS